MLLTETVKMRWNPANKNYYISKGYTFTKMKSEFEIKIEHLPYNSHIKVNVQCDECGKILNPMTWQGYNQNIKEENKYYCHTCVMDLYGNENHRKTKLKNGKSFYDWCIEHNRQDILELWDYELNGRSPKDISYGTQKKYYFKCPRGLHPSELKSINHITNKSTKELKCNMCNSFAQWGYDNIDDEFLEKYWDYSKNVDKYGNPIDPWKINKCSDKKAWIFCQEKSYHGSYKITYNSFYNNSRCGYCNGKKVHKLDSLGYLYPQVITIWSEKNEKSPYDYAPKSNKEVWWKCFDNKHKDYKRSISESNACDFKCFNCVQERDESIIQGKTRLYLESLNYNVLHENNCTLIPINPKTKYPLTFDNEIILINNKRLIIEVNGIQHYKVSGFHLTQANHNNTTPEQEFHYQRLKDRYKRFITYKNGYEYLELPYWVFDDNDTYKQLINNKIKEISSRVGDDIGL